MAHLSHLHLREWRWRWAGCVILMLCHHETIHTGNFHRKGNLMQTPLGRCYHTCCKHSQLYMPSSSKMAIKQVNIIGNATSTEITQCKNLSKFKRRLHRLVWVYTFQNATLLETTCRGSNLFNFAMVHHADAELLPVTVYSAFRLSINDMAEASEILSIIKEQNRQSSIKIIKF